MKKIFSLFVFLGIVFSSCVTNVEDVSQPAEEPDEVISYSEDVQPIFNQNCTVCHGNNGGISLVSYQATTSGNGNNYGANLIIPNDADASGLIDKLEPNPDFGQIMPQGGSLTATEIAIIKAWINQGALDN